MFERDVTQDEQEIINQRVALQRKMFEEVRGYPERMHVLVPPTSCVNMIKKINNMCHHDISVLYRTFTVIVTGLISTSPFAGHRGSKAVPYSLKSKYNHVFTLARHYMCPASCREDDRLLLDIQNSFNCSATGGETTLAVIISCHSTT